MEDLATNPNSEIDTSNPEFIRDYLVEVGITDAKERAEFLAAICLEKAVSLIELRRDEDFGGLFDKLPTKLIESIRGTIYKLDQLGIEVFPNNLTDSTELEKYSLFFCEGNLLINTEKDVKTDSKTHTHDQDGKVLIPISDSNISNFYIRIETKEEASLISDNPEKNPLIKKVRESSPENLPHAHTLINQLTKIRETLSELSNEQLYKIAIAISDVSIVDSLRNVIQASPYEISLALIMETGEEYLVKPDEGGSSFTVMKTNEPETEIAYQLQKKKYKVEDI